MSGKAKAKSKRGAAIMKKNINFKGCTETLEEIFGKKKIARSDVVKIISAYIKAKDLVDPSV